MWNKVLSMRTVQIVLDEELLGVADRVARKSKVSRSALVRQALREYLQKLHLREQERRDREGYERYPDTPGELDAWERVAVWPWPRVARARLEGAQQGEDSDLKSHHPL